MFERAIQETLRRVDNQNYKLQSTPLSPMESLGLSQFAESFTPVISPDGFKLLLLTKNETTRRSMQILKRALFPPQGLSTLLPGA